jgi:hypothetical protein
MLTASRAKKQDCLRRGFQTIPVAGEMSRNAEKMLDISKSVEHPSRVIVLALLPAMF